MWSERLPSQAPSSTTQHPPRQYSPSPRRPSHLSQNSFQPRASYSPRSSSLSLPLNHSTSSLHNAGKPVYSSSLRRSTNASSSDDIRDPVEALEIIFGKKPSKASQRDQQITKPETLEDVEFGTLSLQEFASSDPDPQARQSSTSLQQPAQDYAKEETKYEDLRQSIAACDDVLKSVESYLTSFQTDLGNVSSEIESLQSRSVTLNKRLDNRKKVETILGPSVEDFSISPAIIRKLTEGSIDDSWPRILQDIDRRYESVKAKSRSKESVKALQDAQPILRNLIDKSLERIRDYFVSQIKALRSPNINAQILQQQNLLRYKELFAFLAKHHPKLSEEIGQAYINTMRWYYQLHFQRYQTALSKINVHVIDKSDAVGQEDNTRRGTVLGSVRQGNAPYDAFSIGRRSDLLKSSNRLALSSYLAEEDKSTHYLEIPFRNFNVALIDNAFAEYSFLSEFFGHNSFHQISRRFTQIFDPSCAIGQNLTKSLVDSTADCLGVLLCIRLNQHFAFDLQRRKIPTLDSYINGINMLLWPRFQMIMDIHCESLRKASTASTAGSAAPHSSTQKFSQLLQGITVLSSEAGDDEPISSSLGRLRGEYQSFIGRASKTIGDQRKRQRFLSNNYHLILTILGDTKGKLAEEQRDHFQTLVDNFTDSK